MLIYAIIGAAVGALSTPVVVGLVRRWTEQRPNTWLVGIVGAITCAATGYRFAGDPVLLSYLVLTITLVIQSAIDQIDHRLPREITYPAIVITSAVMGLVALDEGDPTSLMRALVGAALSTAVLLAIHLASNRAMGEGDVRLAPLLGLHLGYIHLSLLTVAFFVAFASASVVALIRRKGRASSFAFGPFLAFGTLIAIWLS